jgi:drug/metabolite transporter (DMT)-like permease
MFVGLALVVEVDKFGWGGHIVGDLMMVAAALGFSINAFVIRHIMLVMDESPVALYNHFISALGFLGLALVTGDLARTAEVFSDAKAWIGMAVLGVLICVSLPLYYVALRRMHVWKLRMFMLSTPVLTAVIEWPLWGEKLSWSQMVGALIILASLAVLIQMEWRMTRRSSTPKAESVE